jgi:hypothetical protein
MTKLQRGKTASGKTIPQRKELVEIILKKDAEIGRLMRRISYVEAVNNDTQKEADLIKSKYWLRTWLFRLVTRIKSTV